MWIENTLALVLLPYQIQEMATKEMTREDRKERKKKKEKRGNAEKWGKNERESDGQRKESTSLLQRVLALGLLAVKEECRWSCTLVCLLGLQYTVPAS